MNHPRYEDRATFYRTMHGNYQPTAPYTRGCGERLKFSQGENPTRPTNFQAASPAGCQCSAKRSPVKRGPCTDLCVDRFAKTCLLQNISAAIQCGLGKSFAEPQPSVIPNSVLDPRAERSQDERQHDGNRDCNLRAVGSSRDYRSRSHAARIDQNTTGLVTNLAMIRPSRQPHFTFDTFSTQFIPTTEEV